MAAASIAVLIPCYNEALTVAQVVSDFRRELPEAQIWVFDNNSKDGTDEIARRAGAIVAYEQRQGKGYVVQSMFRKVDADIYIMVDGDSTYSASLVHQLIAPILQSDADMVIGSRLLAQSSSEFRLLNRFGNQMFLWVLHWLFGVRLTDLLSGYRAFSRRLVRGLPLFGGGFQTEAEMTIKALQRNFSIMEVPSDLGTRPEGSHSKINILGDGMAILNCMITLLRDYKPLTFFATLGTTLILLGCIPGALVTVEFLKTGLVPRLPSALLAVGLVLAGLIFIFVGLVLHTIVRRFQELDWQLQTLGDELRSLVDR